MTYEPTDGDPALAEVIRKRLDELKAERESLATACPNCNPTARAIQWVINKWIEASINRGE